MDNICLYLNYLPELPTEFPKNFVNHFDFESGIKGIKKFLKLEKNKEKLFKSEFINYYTFVKFKPTSVTLSTCTQYDIYWTIDIEEALKNKTHSFGHRLNIKLNCYRCGEYIPSKMIYRHKETKKCSLFRLVDINDNSIVKCKKCDKTIHRSRIKAHYMAKDCKNIDLKFSECKRCFAMTDSMEWHVQLCSTFIKTNNPDIFACSRCNKFVYANDRDKHYNCTNCTYDFNKIQENLIRKNI